MKVQAAALFRQEAGVEGAQEGLRTEYSGSALQREWASACLTGGVAMVFSVGVFLPGTKMETLQRRRLLALATQQAVVSFHCRRTGDARFENCAWCARVFAPLHATRLVWFAFLVFVSWHVGGVI